MIQRGRREFWVNLRTNFTYNIYYIDLAKAKSEALEGFFLEMSFSSNLTFSISRKQPEFHLKSSCQLTLTGMSNTKLNTVVYYALDS